MIFQKKFDKIRREIFPRLRRAVKYDQRKDGCPVPSNEMLSTIREAEAAAKTLVEEAEAASLARLKDAASAAAARREEAVKRAEEDAAAAIAKAREGADALLRDAEKAAIEEADKLSQAADRNMGEAVRIIIGGVETLCQ